MSLANMERAIEEFQSIDHAFKIDTNMTSDELGVALMRKAYQLVYAELLSAFVRPPFRGITLFKLYTVFDLVSGLIIDECNCNIMWSRTGAENLYDYEE